MTAGDRWFFDRIAPVYDLAMVWVDQGPLIDALEQGTGEVLRVIDVGGGTGRAARAVGGDSRVVVDTSQGMLRRVPRSIAPVRGTSDRLPLPDRSVDAVLIVDALHHIPDRPETLDEATRVIRPGGVVVIRDFEPETRRGRILEFGEHLIGMRSSFRSADAVAAALAETGLEASVLERGFIYTVVGVKPKSIGDAKGTTNG